MLKQAAIDSDKIWKTAGRPRHGHLFDKRQKCRLLYRRRIREGQRTETERYTNDLHEELLKKKPY